MYFLYDTFWKESDLCKIYSITSQSAAKQTFFFLIVNSVSDHGGEPMS